MNPNLGQGLNVVLDLVRKLKISERSELLFDNQFSTFPLHEHLSEMKIGGFGTEQQEPYLDFL